MYIAMAIAAGLCLMQGLIPETLYRLLPNPVHYHPYDAWKLLQATLLLGFTGLGFFFMRKVIQPHAGRNLDFDALYRLVGRAVTAMVTRPLAAIDNVWTEIYRAVGLKVLMGVARASSIFDRKGIDTVVDGTAYTVRGLGRFSSRLQTGRLQDHLAWMTIIALLFFALVWGVADIG
jgi:multicomponent Na+:H+ antiporter subunit D